MLTRFILTTLFIVFTTHVHAEGAGLVSQIATISVFIPNPSGFADPSATAPALQALGEKTTLSANRLLAMFVTESDIKKSRSGEWQNLQRHFLVQTPRRDETKTYTASDFTKFKSMAKKQYADVAKKAQITYQSDMDSTSMAVAKSNRMPDLSIKIGETRVQEIFDERPESLSMLIFTKYAINNGGKTEELPMAIGLTTLIIKGKMVFFYAYSKYKSLEDFDWVKTQTKSWLSRVRETN